MHHKSHDAYSCEIYIINIETYTISDTKPAVLTLQKVTQSHDASNISTETDTVT